MRRLSLPGDPHPHRRGEETTLKFKDLKIGDRFVWADERLSCETNLGAPFVKSDRFSYEKTDGVRMSAMGRRGYLVRKLDAREKPNP